jgi:hypothetical protein
MHGWLQKKGAINPAWQTRFVRVTENAAGKKVLAYYKEATDSEPKGIILLPGATIHVADDAAGAAAHQFDMTIPDGSRTFFFRAPSLEEKLRWLDVLTAGAARTTSTAYFWPLLDGDHYVQLGVPPTSSGEDIKRSYDERAEALQPDRNSTLEAKQKLLQLESAFWVLRDATRRSQYDHNLKRSRDKRMHNIFLLSCCFLCNDCCYALFHGCTGEKEGREGKKPRSNGTTPSTPSTTSPVSEGVKQPSSMTPAVAPTPHVDTQPKSPYFSSSSGSSSPPPPSTAKKAIGPQSPATSQTTAPTSTPVATPTPTPTPAPAAATTVTPSPSVAPAPTRAAVTPAPSVVPIVASPTSSVPPTSPTPSVAPVATITPIAAAPAPSPAVAAEEAPAFRQRPKKNKGGDTAPAAATITPVPVIPTPAPAPLNRAPSTPVTPASPAPAPAPVATPTPSSPAPASAVATPTPASPTPTPVTAAPITPAAVAIVSNGTPIGTPAASPTATTGGTAFNFATPTPSAPGSANATPSHSRTPSALPTTPSPAASSPAVSPDGGHARGHSRTPSALPMGANLDPSLSSVAFVPSVPLGEALEAVDKGMLLFKLPKWGGADQHIFKITPYPTPVSRGMAIKWESKKKASDG